MQTFIDRYIEQGRQQGLFAGRQEGLQEGLQKGLQKGHQEGRREGQRQARVDMLLQQMARKFGALSAEHQQRIKQADEAALLRWLEQILFAETAEEALR